MKRLLTTLLSACLAISLQAQTGHFFSTDRGLQSSLVNHIMQDERGYVWVATRNGLMRYDSHQFTTYQNTGQAGCLKSNYTYSVAVDRQGRLLVGTDAGLQQFDYATERFSDIPLMSADSKGERMTCAIGKLMPLRQGDIIITTSGYGLFRLKPGQGRAIRDNSFPLSEVTQEVIEADDGTIWACTETGIVYHTDGKNARQYQNPTEHGKLITICIDKQGRVYAGTVADGIYIYDKEQDQFRHLTSTGTLHVSALLPLSDGTLMIGTNGNGASIYHPADDRLEPCGYYSHEVNLDQGKVSSLMEDREGNIWMGLFQKGLFMQPTRLQDFGYLGPKSGRRNVIGTACVMSLFHDSQDIYWIGTDGDGLYAVESSGRQAGHYLHDSSGGGYPSTVMSIAEDPDQGMWVGTFLQGAGRIDRRTGRFEQLPFTAKGYAIHIFDILFDRQGRLWISTLGDGLKCYNPKTGALTEYRMPTEDKGDQNNVLTNNWTSDITLSRDGQRLYICMSSGLSCLDLDSGSFTSVFGRNHILGGVAMQRVFEDRDGTLWAGSSKGLYKITLNPLTTKRYTTADGLTDNSISSIEQDSQGCLWISTAYGMSVMDPAKETFTNYFASNGLQGNEFSERASDNVGDSLMAFGGSSGVTFFNPLRLGASQTPLSVYLADLKVNGEHIAKGMKSGHYEIVDTVVMDASRFDLAHDDNSLTISLSAMDFGNAGGIRYAYHIGSDPWSTLPEGINEVSLSHLPPGTYHFHVKALRNGQESAEKTLDIVIHPAWYATTWAYLCYALLVILFVWWYLRNLHREEQFKLRLQEHIHAEQLDEARTQLVKAQAQMIENISQEAAPDIDSPDEKLLRRIIAVTNKHIANPDYNVEMIAAEVGLSRVHLYRKMKELTNQSPSEFISNIRLKQAAQMLSGQSPSIEEVAYSCGFNSPNSFSRKFKAFYGKSPKDYMKEHAPSPEKANPQTD